MRGPQGVARSVAKPMTDPTASHLMANGAELAPVLELLHAAQRTRGYVDGAALEAASQAAGTSPAELYGAVAAYPRFRLEPAPPVAERCEGLPCHLRRTGSEAGQGAGQGTATSPPLGGTGEPMGSACLGLCEQGVAWLTPDGPRIEGADGALLVPGDTAPAVHVVQSAFFGDDDPVEEAETALGRTPEALLALVEESGLRGRGGAGFPVARKWAAVRAASGAAPRAEEGKRTFVVCNADESEPGTFKDRALLDQQPRRVLAGLLIAARAVGADAAIVYLRHEYARAYERLETEIGRLRDAGLLVQLGADFDVVVRRGAGLYVCGEETALLNSLEGRRPVPRDRPPHTAEHGLYGMPTLVQNVETLAALPAIVSRGGTWFRKAGRPKLYCASGDVAAPGVFELPLGATVTTLLEYAGTAVEELGAFTLGGLSGGLLPASAADVRLDFEDPRRLDAHLGSGAVVALGRERCVVRAVREAMRFFAGESCGRCFPCRIGTTRLRERLDALCALDGAGGDDLDPLVRLVTTGSACGLGPAAALLVQHLADSFPDELAAHREGRCPSGECGGG